MSGFQNCQMCTLLRAVCGNLSDAAGTLGPCRPSSVVSSVHSYHFQGLVGHCCDDYSPYLGPLVLTRAPHVTQRMPPTPHARQ